MTRSYDVCQAEVAKYDKILMSCCQAEVAKYDKIPGGRVHCL